MTETEEPDKIGPARWTVIAVAVAFAAGSFLYRYLTPNHRWQSSAMFIGLPTVMAVLLAMTPKAKTVTSGALCGLDFPLGPGSPAAVCADSDSLGRSGDGFGGSGCHATVYANGDVRVAVAGR